MFDPKCHVYTTVNENDWEKIVLSANTLVNNEEFLVLF